MITLETIEGSTDDNPSRPKFFQSWKFYGMVAAIIIITVIVVVISVVTTSSDSNSSNGGGKNNIVPTAAITYCPTDFRATPPNTIAPVPAPTTNPSTPTTPLPHSDDPIQVIIQSSNTKEAWLNNVIAEFHAQDFTYNNRSINVTVYHTGSTFKPELFPTIWSPANAQFIRLQGTEDSTVYVTDEEKYCYSVTDIPVGIAMWRTLAEALGWPDQPITFEQLGELALVSSGWASIDSSLSHYGSFKFGHGHPDSSNSGRLSFISMIYAFGIDELEEYLDIEAIDNATTNPDVIAITQSVAHLGKIDTDLLNRMKNHGPTYLHAVANYESNVVYWNQIYSNQLTSWGDDWVFVYLADGTFWMTHPLCILDGIGASSWVTEDEIGAAQIFADYATNKTQLQKLLQYGIRPTETADISDITCCSSTITQENGADPTKNLATINLLNYPPDNVMTYAIDTWHWIKKPAAFAVVIDTSGSMSTTDTNLYSRMYYAKQAVINFINSTDPQDWIYLTGFGSSYSTSGHVCNVKDGAIGWVETLLASGSTPIYGSMQDAWVTLNNLKTSNEAEGIEWNYGLISLTDGEPSDGDLYNDFFGSPYNYEISEELSTNSDIIHIFPIIFGDSVGDNEMDFQLLADVSGGKYFKTDADTIVDIYFQVSLEL